jgi:heme-degrading monooxygenase HmoA
MSATSQPAPVYRVDKFVVPAAGRDEFLGRVAETHALLRAQPGFVRDLILEQRGGPGEFNVVTLVEWASAEALPPVVAAVTAEHRRVGFDREATLARLGVRADLGTYGPLEL